MTQETTRLKEIITENVERISKLENASQQAVNDLTVYAKMLEGHESELLKACIIIKEFDHVELYSKEWEELAEKHLELNEQAITNSDKSKNQIILQMDTVKLSLERSLL